MKLFFKQEDITHIPLAQKLFNMAIVVFFLSLLLVFALSSLDYSWRFQTIYTYREKFFDGFIMTMIMYFFSLILSFLLGSFFALASRSSFLPLAYLSKVYVEIIRGTPLLVQIYVFFYVVATAFNLSNRYILGVVILSIFSGAYICEILRAGIESIDPSQIETARSLGFTPWQRYRFIIVPQVVKRVLPSLAGQFASIIKDSSLLSVIAVSELTKNVQEVDSLNFAVFENYLALAFLYMILTLPISLLSKKIERKFSYES